MARKREDTGILSARREDTGILIVAASAPLTFQRTLMPRSNMDQALVTGLSASINNGLASVLQETIQSAALVAARGRVKNASRAIIVADLAAMGAGFALQRVIPPRDREKLSRAGVRTGALLVAGTGMAGALVGLLQESPIARKRGMRPVLAAAGLGLAATGEYRRRRGARLDVSMPPEDTGTSALKSVASGAVVAVVATGFGRVQSRTADAISRGAARVLPGTPNMWRPVGHVVTLAGLTLGARALMQRAYARISAREESVEAAFDIPPPNPLVSGSLDSFVPFETLSKQGRRYSWLVMPRDKIEEIMGEPAVAQPIRAYVGLESADTEEARVELALQELERTNAFDRSWLMLVSPTGTGYVNYAAVDVFEFLNRGDCATLAMQYSARPSPLSLDRVAEGRHHMRMLVAAIADRLKDRPVDKRPKIMLFGESLGAWSSQDPFVGKGTQGLQDAGVDRAIWIGTPHFSKWKEEVLFDDRPDIDRSVVGKFASIGDFDALDEEDRARIRYCMITHHEDGVAVFGPELMVQSPPWLGKSETRAPTVPPGMQWMPTTAFLQVLVDMKNSATVVPGVFEAKGHDYRADLLPFFHAMLGRPATAAQLQSISEFLQWREQVRSEWIKKHGDAGRSLSATIVRRWMDEQHSTGGDEAFTRLVRDIVDEEFQAGGGATV